MIKQQTAESSLTTLKHEAPERTFLEADRLPQFVLPLHMSELSHDLHGEHILPTGCTLHVRSRRDALGIDIRCASSCEADGTDAPSDLDVSVDNPLHVKKNYSTSLVSFDR